MSTIILISGIITLSFLIATIVARLRQTKISIHKTLGYSTITIALIHGGLALYRYIKINYFY